MSEASNIDFLNRVFKSRSKYRANVRNASFNERFREKEDAEAKAMEDKLYYLSGKEKKKQIRAVRMSGDLRKYY